jgi:hypothetical protein
MVKAITGKTQETLAKDLSVDQPVLRALQNEPREQLETLQAHMAIFEKRYGLRFTAEDDQAITVHFSDKD